MTLKEALTEIKDVRIERCKRHDLVDILMIVLIGTLCGYKSIEEIHFNAELSEEALKKYLNLPSGIPSTDTILRVLAGIDRKQMEKIVAKDAKETFGKNIGSNEVISIDGKTIKRSASEQQKPSHVVSAFSGTSCVVIKEAFRRTGRCASGQAK